MHGYPPDMGPDGMHGGPLGPPPPPPGEIPFHHGGPGAHMNLTPPPQSLPGHVPPGMQGPPGSDNGVMYQPPDLPYMDGPGGCPPLGTDMPGEHRNSPSMYLYASWQTAATAATGRRNGVVRRKTRGMQPYQQKTVKL